MTQIDLTTGDVQEVILPNGKVVKLSDLASSDDVKKALKDQSDKFGPGVEIAKALQTNGGRRQLFNELAQWAQQNDPDAIAQFATASGLARTPEPMEEPMTSGAPDFEVMTRLFAEEMERTVGPLRQQMANMMAQGQMKEEVTALKTQFPGLTPEQIQRITTIAAEGQQPGKLRLTDFAKIGLADDREQELTNLRKELTEAKASTQANDMFAEFFGQKQATKPGEESEWAWGNKGKDTDLASDIISQTVREMTSGKLLDIPTAPPSA